MNINTYIDTLGIRCECDSKYQRDSLFSRLINFLREKKIVAIKYNEKRSNKYYQVTDLLFANRKLATINKGYYKNENNILNPDYYYININFYGLKRYNIEKDDASILLIKLITAFLNTKKIHFILIELDIAMDIESKIENILALCTRRSPNVNYYQLGNTDIKGKNIQDNKGTYYIEKFNSYKQKKNAMSRAYLYNKRYKELSKFKRDIGCDITRFELKLQKRYFVNNEYTGGSIYKAMEKYSVLWFENMKQKELFIEQYNKVKTSRKRRKRLDIALENNNVVLLTPNLNNVSSFLREIDSITFNSKGNFKYVKHENYLYCQSKFNRKY